MSCDFIIKWLLIGITIATTAALITSLGLQFPVDDLWSPLLIAAALAAAAWYYRMHKVDNFVATLNALLFLTSFTACYSVMMYAGAAIGRPLVDDSLVRFDAVCGIHLPDIIDWAHTRPRVELALQCAYNSLLWQTPLVITLLGFSGDLKPLRQFVMQFMLAAWICALFFFLLPAAGPFAAFGYEMNATQTRYLQHLHELRDGDADGCHLARRGGADHVSIVPHRLGHTARLGNPRPQVALRPERARERRRDRRHTHHRMALLRRRPRRCGRRSGNHLPGPPVHSTVVSRKSHVGHAN